jgi:hypothetical protein
MGKNYCAIKIATIPPLSLGTFKKFEKLCILIQIKSDLLELFYLAFYIGRFYEICIFSLYPE